jgi:O-antigen biosynthesis protein
MNSSEIPHQNLWYDAVSPEVSIILVNFNKGDLTRECLRHIWAHTRNRRYEIIVVDNGSSAAEFQKLSEFAGNFRLSRLPVNRFFGEGTNIGVEISRGRYIVFLNNDAMVTDDWLEPLITLLENKSDAGGVGPKFLYPDGRLQEAGAFMDERGISIQRGKEYNLEPPVRDTIATVDYCSAACFATLRAIFDRISGFDPKFEPGYYEDADLCFKIISLGLFIYYCPQSVVHHIENATTSAFRDELEYVKELNRKKFLYRWGDYLSGRARGEGAPLPLAAPPRPRAICDAQLRRPIAVFHAPYDLIPYHRERYLLTAASALYKSHHVYVATDARYSSYRLDYLARDLSLDLSQISITTRSELHRLRSIDLFFHMSDHAFPLVAPLGRRSFYKCQFPFPIKNRNSPELWENLGGYDCVLVESAFAQGLLRSKINAFQFDVEPKLLAPPVSVNSFNTNFADKSFERPIIVSVGKFSVHGHSQRHDILIEGIKCLIEAGIDAELHLVGTPHLRSGEMLHPDLEDVRCYKALCQRADGLPVHFHKDALPEVARDLLSRATIYWHSVGFEIDPLFSPEKCEHFGITVLEAMAAGCIPFVVANGAPLEFVHEEDTGFQYATLQDLVLKTRDILRNPARAAAISQRAIQEARGFADPAFIANWRRIARE